MRQRPHSPEEACMGLSGEWKSRLSKEDAMWARLGAVHDQIFSAKKKMWIKRIILRMSVAGFLLHLALIALGRTVPQLAVLATLFGDNYLVAIATPFNCILFYEVLTLIAVLPASNTRSIANQFEIVSLIFIRDVFRDLPHAVDLVTEHKISTAEIPLFVDMWAGLAMYLLVAVFRHLARQRTEVSVTSLPSRHTLRFVDQKKAIAILLSALLTMMAVYNLFLLGSASWHVLATGEGGALVEHATTYYNDLFTVMIFTDVLIVILSLAVSGYFEMVFRNAAYVVAVILLRFSLTQGYPLAAPLALGAMLFGIGALVIFNYHTHVSGPSSE